MKRHYVGLRDAGLTIDLFVILLQFLIMDVDHRKNGIRASSRFLFVDFFNSTNKKLMFLYLLNTMNSKKP